MQAWRSPAPILHAGGGRTKKAPRERGLECGGGCRESLGRLDPGRLCALGALLHFVADPLAFLQAAEALGIDRGEMHENVCAAVLGRDEAEALGVVEPLHGAVLHGCDDLLRKRSMRAEACGGGRTAREYATNPRACTGWIRRPRAW